VDILILQIALKLFVHAKAHFNETFNIVAKLAAENAMLGLLLTLPRNLTAIKLSFLV